MWLSLRLEEEWYKVGMAKLASEFFSVTHLCPRCNEEVYYDKDIRSKNNKCIPLDPVTHKYHSCRTSVNKRKGMLRILTRTQVEYYKLLEIYPGATVEEINTAFKQCQMKYHPDHAKFNKELYEIHYKRIVKAYNNIRLIYVRDE